MKRFIRISFLLLLISFSSMAFFSCKQTSKTTFLPLGGGGFSGSASAVVLNAATAAYHSYYSQRVAFDHSGWGVAVWYSDTGNNNRILCAIYNPSKGAWSPSQELARGGNESSVASNGAGIMIIVSVQNNVYAVSCIGGVLGKTVRISSGNAYCYSPAIASNGTGYCAVWTEYNDLGYQNINSNIHNGTSWQTAPTWLEHVSVASSNPTVVSNGSGYCAIWRNNSYHHFANVYTGGAWTISPSDPRVDIDSGAINNNTYYVAGSATHYVVLYDYYTGARYDINSIRYTIASDSWTVLSNIDNGDTYHAYNPHIASNGTTICAVWEQNNGSNSRIYSKTMDSTGAWDASATLVDTVSTDYTNSYSPDISSNGTGYCAAWQQYCNTTGNYQICSNFNTGTWGTPAAINPADTDASDSAAVVSNGSGYLVTWEDYNSSLGVYRLMGSAYAGSSWSPFQTIDSGSYPTGGIGSAGFPGGYCVYFGSGGTAVNDIQANMYRDSLWSGATSLIVPAWHGSCNIYTPKILTAGATTMAVWTQYDNSSNRLNASVKTGSAWSVPFQLADNVDSFDAASSGTGIYVVWSYYDSSSGPNYYKLKGRMYTAGAWSAEEELQTHTSYGFYNLAAAGNGSTNDFCIAWTQYDGSYNRVRAQVHTTTPVPAWGAATQVDNTGLSFSADYLYLIAGSTNYCLLFNQNSRTYARVYNTSSWDGPTIIDNGSAFYDRNVAASGTSFLAAWNESSHIYANLYEGSWGGPDRFDTTYGYEGCVAGNGTGGFCIVWQGNIYNGSDIFSCTYDGSWGDPVTVGYFPGISLTYNAAGPCVASNGTGYAVAFIEGDQNNIYHLYANIFDGAEWLGAEVLEDSLINMNTYLYQITSNGTGYGIAWLQMGENLRKNVYGSSYRGARWHGRALSNGESDASDNDPLITATGNSYTALWSQNEKTDALVNNMWANTFK